MKPTVRLVLAVALGAIVAALLAAGAVVWPFLDALSRGW